MLVACLIAALLFLSVGLVGLVLAMKRIARNAGLLDLEDYARRKRCVYIPVSTELVEGLREWSKPVQLRIASHQHPLLVELVVREQDQKPPE